MPPRQYGLNESGARSLLRLRCSQHIDHRRTTDSYGEKPAPTQVCLGVESDAGAQTGDCHRPPRSVYESATAWAALPRWRAQGGSMADRNHYAPRAAQRGGAMQQDVAIRCAQRRPRVSYTSAATPPLRTLSANWGLRVGSRMLPSSAHCVAETIEKREHRFKVSWYLCGSSGRSQLLPPGRPRVSLPWFRHRRPKASRTAGASCGASSRLF